MNTFDLRPPTKIRFAALCALAAITVGWSATSFADGAGGYYEFHRIAADLFEPFPGDINNRREVIGYFNSEGEVRAFTWDDGSIETFIAPGAENTFGNGNNDRGLLGGHAVTGDFNGPGTNTGFVKAGRFFIDIRFRMDGIAFNSWVFDISNRGSIVGIYCEDGEVPGCLNEEIFPFGGTEVLHAYMLSRRGYETIDPPGALLAVGLGVNDHRVAVGSFDDEFGSHGFIRDRHGNFTTVDFPGSIFTEIRGINNDGVTVGQFVPFEPPDFPNTGFVRQKNGEYAVVNFPGAAGTAVTAINDHGDICGFYFTENFEELRGFVAYWRDGDDEDDDDDDRDDDDDDDDDDD